MSGVIVGGAYYGARFEKNNPLEIRAFFRPSRFHTKGPGETSQTYSVFTSADPIRVGNVGTRSSASAPWTFRDAYASPVSINPASLEAFLTNEFLNAPEYPFFTLDGAPLPWFTKTYTKFLNGIKVVMPTAPVSLTSTVREIITSFTVDTSGNAPVVSSITKEPAAKISFVISKHGTGGFVSPSDPAHVATLDGDVYGKIEFKSLYNTSFTYTDADGPIAGVLRDFERKFSFAAMAEPSIWE